MTFSLAAVAAAALLAQALPRDPAELAWTFLAMLLASGLSASVVSSRAERRARRAESARADVDRAFDALLALLALRSAYRRRADDDPAAPDDQTLFDLVDGLDSTARRVSPAAAAAARTYARAGVLLTRRDPEGPADQEAVAYHRLATALVAARNAYR